MAPMQQRWAPDGAGGLRYDNTWWNSEALDDLAYLQQELSEDLLNLYETRDPEAASRLRANNFRTSDHLLEPKRGKSRA